MIKKLVSAIAILFAIATPARADVRILDSGRAECVNGEQVAAIAAGINRSNIPTDLIIVQFLPYQDSRSPESAQRVQEFSQILIASIVRNRIPLILVCDISRRSIWVISYANLPAEWQGIEWNAKRVPGTEAYLMVPSIAEDSFDF